MILVRLGVALMPMVAALFFLVARPPVEDTTRRAFGSIGDPAAVIAAVKRELGPKAQLLDITFTGESGSVKYRSGDGAKGYQWGPGHHGLEPVNVTLIGDGKLADNVFPIGKLDPAAPAKLTAAVKAKAGAGFETRSMMLAIDPATGTARWTITGQAHGRTRAFTANSAVTRLRPSGYRPRA